MRSGSSDSSGTGNTLPASSWSVVIELAFVALAGARLGAEAALQAAGAHAGRRAAGLWLGGAAAVRGAVLVAARLRPLGLGVAFGEARWPRSVPRAALLLAARAVVRRVERAGVRVD